MPDEFDFRFEWQCDAVDRILPDAETQSFSVPLGSICVLFHRGPQQAGLEGGQPKYVRMARLTYEFELGSGKLMLATDNLRYDEPGDPKISRNFNVSRAAKASSRDIYGVWHSGRIVWTKQKIQHWVDGKHVLEVPRRKLLDMQAGPIPGDVNLWDVSHRFAPRGLYLTLGEFDGAMRFRNLRLALPGDSSRAVKDGEASNVFRAPPLPR